MHIFIRCTSTEKFEKVDKNVYDKRRFAISDDDSLQSRYSDDVIILNDNGGINVSGNITAQELLKVLRSGGFKTPETTYDPIVTEPSTVRFKSGKRQSLYFLATGETFTKTT